MAETSSKGRPLCPSAQPSWQGSAATGVIGGTADDPSMSQVPLANSRYGRTALPRKTGHADRSVSICSSFVFTGGCLSFPGTKMPLVHQNCKLVTARTCSIRWIQEGQAACMLVRKS
jgi:hypothetical protein